MGFRGFLFIIFIFASAFIIIYGFVLFVKLAHRAIKALDLYIDEKKKENTVVLPTPFNGEPASKMPVQNRGELSAVIAASIATVMGTDVAGIRIVSCKRVDDLPKI